MGAPKRDCSCGVCEKPVGRFGACGHCGALVSPSLDEWLVGERSWPFWSRRPGGWLNYVAVVAVLVLGFVAIGQYAFTEAGQARLLELALLIVGPVATVGLAWVAHRVWYRRRYPDDD